MDNEMKLAAEIALRRHIAQDLSAHIALSQILDGIDGPSGRAASGRQLSIAVAQVRDWSGGGFSGREVQLLLTLQDDARDDEGIGKALNIIDDALQKAPPEMPGWCIVNMQPLTRRILRGSDARWRALGRYRVRMIAQ
jgi:hypothetical protein